MRWAPGVGLPRQCDAAEPRPSDVVPRIPVNPFCIIRLRRSVRFLRIMMVSLAMSAYDCRRASSKLPLVPPCAASAALAAASSEKATLLLVVIVPFRVLPMR